MRKEVDQLAKFLRSLRKESANLQFRLAYRGLKEEREDSSYCEGDEIEEIEDDVKIKPCMPK